MYLGDDAANTTGHHISEEEMELAIHGLIRLQSPVPRTDKEKTESLSQELYEQDASSVTRHFFLNKNYAMMSVP